MSVQEATLEITEIALDYLGPEKGTMQVLYSYDNPSVLDVPVSVTAELYRNGLRVWQKDLNLQLGAKRSYSSKSMKFYWSSAYVPSTALHPDTDHLFTIWFRNNTGIYQTGGLDFHTPALGDPPVGTTPPPDTEPPPESESGSSWKKYALIGVIGAIGLMVYNGAKKKR